MHDFEVRIADPEHPVTSGMKAFRITDELWHRVGVTGKLNVLATAFAAKSKGGTGADEPAAHWRPFGKGRSFHLILGHDPRAMDSAGWTALMLRGTEWAATSKVTLPLPEELRASK
ncbi:ThuA domain-containing protein [bacterium]|nr:ThuA domain-containing protein [bacterium]